MRTRLQSFRTLTSQFDHVWSSALTLMCRCTSSTAEWHDWHLHEVGKGIRIASGVDAANASENLPGLIRFLAIGMSDVPGPKKFGAGLTFFDYVHTAIAANRHMRRAFAAGATGGAGPATERPAALVAIPGINSVLKNQKQTAQGYAQAQNQGPFSIDAFHRLAEA